MRRRTPPKHLTEAFREEAFVRFTHFGPEDGTGYPLRLYNGGPACWLKQFDPLDRACSGDLEACHLIGRQRIRNVLRGQLVTDIFATGAIDVLDVDDLVEQAEWDPRIAAPGCTGHHRRLDSHATPELKLPAQQLLAPHREFILEWGLESEAERKFIQIDRATWLTPLDRQPPVEAVERAVSGRSSR
jgi:hypothetical protein